MMLCALLFWPLVEPRETVSGLVGRFAYRGWRLAKGAAFVIDLFHWWEPGHCERTWRLEDEMRRGLYS